MGVLLRLLWTCSRWLFIGGGSVPLPPPRSDSCSSIRHLRSGSFLPLRNLLRMLRLLPFGCQLRKSYSRRDSWRLQLQRRCWYRSGRYHKAFGRKLRRYRYSLLAVAPEALRHPALNQEGPQRGEGTSLPQGTPSERAPPRK